MGAQTRRLAIRIRCPLPEGKRTPEATHPECIHPLVGTSERSLPRRPPEVQLPLGRHSRAAHPRMTAPGASTPWPALWSDTIRDGRSECNYPLVGTSERHPFPAPRRSAIQIPVGRSVGLPGNPGGWDQSLRGDARLPPVGRSVGLPGNPGGGTKASAAMPVCPRSVGRSVFGRYVRESCCRLVGDDGRPGCLRPLAGTPEQPLPRRPPRVHPPLGGHFGVAPPAAHAPSATTPW